MPKFARYCDDDVEKNPFNMIITAMMNKVNLTLMAGLMCLCGACSQKNGNQGGQVAQNEKPAQVVDVEGRKNFGGDHPVITPLPAIMIATYDADGTPDVMMAAWGGQCDYNKICVNLSPHKTTDNLRLKKAFTVSFAAKDNVVQSDYFGLVSGNDVPDKVARAGFTVTKSPNVDAPIVNEYPLTLECRVVSMDGEAGTGARVVGEVVNMSADESILDEEGKVDLDKLMPIIYDSSNHSYRVVGEIVGHAWQSGKEIQ